MTRGRGRRLLTLGLAALTTGVVAVSAAPAFATGVSAKASPNKKLTNGQVVKISGKGWPAKDSLVIVECNGSVTTGLSQTYCNLNNVVSIVASSKGVIKGSFTFATG